MQTITDARTATQTFGYNNRDLVTNINYGAAGGAVATPNVSFGYDQAGNRTGMTDGQGSVSYAYDQLSQLQSETRYFNDLGTSYTLSYGYNLSGELSSVTNHWGAQVGYTHDKTGRVSAVTGSGYAGVSSYITSLGYRASGAAKQVSYGNGKQLSVNYDNRLRPTQWNVTGVLGSNYVYDDFGEKSGRVTYAQSLVDATLDREYDYDQVGRLVEAHTGAEARASRQGQGAPADGPYSQSYRYDEWGNMWYRVGWGGFYSPYTDASYNFQNNRLVTNPANGATMQYDAMGNLTYDGREYFQYDAVGKQTYASGSALSQSYDGDGLRVKKAEYGAATYYLRSSVLGGQVIAEINSGGGWARGYVYLGGQLLAIQDGQVIFVHQDPITKSQRLTDTSGNIVAGIELDPWGGDTNRSWNQSRQPQLYTSYTRDGNGSDDAQARRYHGYWNRFAQPDPYDGSYNLADPQSFNRYAYVQNDPVNFTDPSGLEGQPPRAWWGGLLGLLYGQAWNWLIDAGNQRERREPQARRQPPKPEPPPPPPNKKTFRNCFNNNRFSSLFKGTRLHGAAKFAEIGPPTSLAADTAAATYKATRIGIGGSTNAYASGMNYLFRAAASALGNPSIGGTALKGALTTVGNAATIGLAVPGAFTAGYNLSTAVQCGLGVIE